MEHLKDLFATLGGLGAVLGLGWAVVTAARSLSSTFQRRKDRERDLSRIEAARRIGSWLRDRCTMIEWRPDAMEAMDLIGASLAECGDFDELDLRRRFAKELPPEPPSDPLRPATGLAMNDRALTYWHNPADGSDCHVSLFGIRVRDIDDLHDGDKIAEIERQYRVRLAESEHLRDVKKASKAYHEAWNCGNDVDAAKARHALFLLLDKRP